MLLVHRSSNCCKDIPRNLRSTSVSKGSVNQSRHVILAVFSNPFPGHEPGLGLGLVLSSRGSLGLPPSPCLVAIFRLAVAERCRASEPGLLSDFGCRPGRHDVAASHGRHHGAASHSARFRLRDSAQAVEGVAVQSSSLWVSMCSHPRYPRPPHEVSSSVDVVSRPGAAYPQSRPSSRFFRDLAARVPCSILCLELGCLFVSMTRRQTCLLSK